jgi:hypothetical protein
MGQRGQRGRLVSKVHHGLATGTPTSITRRPARACASNAARKGRPQVPLQISDLQALAKHIEKSEAGPRASQLAGSPFRNLLSPDGCPPEKPAGAVIPMLRGERLTQVERSCVYAWAHLQGIWQCAAGTPGFRSDAGVDQRPCQKP